MRALFQRVDDWLGAKVSLGRNKLVLKRRRRQAVFQNSVGEVEHAIGDEAAVDGGDPDAASAELAQPVNNAFCRAVRIDPSLVGDDLCSAFQASGQYGAHAIIEPRVVSGESRVATFAHLCCRNRCFGHRLETQIVEVALVGIECGR